MIGVLRWAIALWLATLAIFSNPSWQPLQLVEPIAEAEKRSASRLFMKLS